MDGSAFLPLLQNAFTRGERMKKRTKVFALAGIISACATVPAMADYVRIGSVDVGFRMDRDSTWSRFGGGMEGLRLVASNSDIACRTIRVTFGDGTQQDVFNGVLPEETPVDVDLRGGTRRVARIDFRCRSDRFEGGRIFVAADVGRFRAEWQRSPEWASAWSRVFTGPNGGPDPNFWVSLGRERFSGSLEAESRFQGWGGRSVDRIGLRAVNADARCRRLTATFGNKHTRQLDVSALSRMERGRVYQIDLPGGDRNLVRLDLLCRPLDAPEVSIEIMARK
jgi:hypothetical protein